jgi:hypothetical protein
VTHLSFLWIYIFIISEIAKAYASESDVSAWLYPNWIKFTGFRGDSGLTETRRTQKNVIMVL